jgi:hypothetical protein
MLKLNHISEVGHYNLDDFFFLFIVGLAMLLRSETRLFYFLIDKMTVTLEVFDIYFI